MMRFSTSTLAALVLCLLFAILGYSQEEEIIIEEEGEETIDYSNLIQTEENKAFCSSKIIGQIPTKIFSVSYDYQANHSFQPAAFSTATDNTENTIENASGLRIGINYPVISKNSFILNLGLNYARTNYSFENTVSNTTNPLTQALNENGLTTLGFNATAFKPLNDKKFLIFQFGASLNGDYSFNNFQSLSYTRFNGAAIYGLNLTNVKCGDWVFLEPIWVVL